MRHPKLGAKALGASALLSLLLSTNALAVPAAPSLKTFQQPDGTTFTGTQYGDEWFSWYRTTDGKVFVLNPATKAYEFAELAVSNGERKLRSTGLAVGARTSAMGSASAASVPDASLWEIAHNQRVRMGVSYPAKQFKPVADLDSGELFAPQATTVGTLREFKTLIVAIEFNDYTLTSPLQTWSSKFFGSQPGGLNDYYSAASEGQARFIPAAESHGTAGDGIVRVSLDKNHPHPGRNTFPAHELFKEALVAADPYVDFSAFDSNDDGALSRDELQLVFLVAGPESATDGENVGVWAHVTGLGNVFGDGVRIANPYACFGERQNGHDATIGVIAHELGHSAFGLPDLYPQVGDWDLMGSGSWGRTTEQQWDGQSPVLMSAWTKWSAGFLNPTYVDPMYTAATHSLRRTLSGNQNALVVPANDARSSFFWLEHRRLEGYDRALVRFFGATHDGKSGLLASKVNDISGKMEVIRADNRASGTTGINNLYFPGGHTRLAPDTTPNTALSNGTPTQYVFENIAYSGDQMTVAVRRLANAGSCQIFTATNSAHVTAGRAYTVVTGTWFKTTTYYAVGSNENLGTLSYTQTTLKESPAGHFSKGSSCPAPQTTTPEVHSIYQTDLNSLEGIATDADGDLARVELEFDGSGTWHRAALVATENAGEWRYRLDLKAMATRNHIARARAIDAAGRVSAVFGPQDFLADTHTPPSCEIESVYLDQANYWTVSGWVTDPDGNFFTTIVSLDGEEVGHTADYPNFTARLSNIPNGGPGALSGTHSVSARASDRTNLMGDCGLFSFETGAQHDPVMEKIEFTLIADNAYVYGDVSDVNGDVTGVELELGGGGQWILAERFYLSTVTQGRFEHVFRTLPPGIYSLRGRAVDASGRRSPASEPVSFEVFPQEAPTCTVDEVYYTSFGALMARGTASDVNDDLSGVQFMDLQQNTWRNTWGSDTWNEMVASVDDPLPPGTYLIQARALDSRGVYGEPCSKPFVVEGVPSVDTLAVSVSGTSATVSGTASDPDNDLQGAEVSLNGTTWHSASVGANGFSHIFSSLTPGNYTAHARALDQTGKYSVVKTANFTIAAPSQCFTTTNSVHASAGRATLKYNVLYYANGTNTYLGLSSDTTSLKLQGTNSWAKVTNCP